MDNIRAQIKKTRWSIFRGKPLFNLITRYSFRVNIPNINEMIQRDHPIIWRYKKISGNIKGVKKSEKIIVNVPIINNNSPVSDN